MRNLSVILAGYIARQTGAVQITNTGSDWDYLCVNPNQKQTRSKENWQGQGKRRKPKMK